MTRFVLLLLSFCLMILGSGLVLAQDAKPPSLRVDNARAFATAPGATAGAAFMTITNDGAADDRLVFASSDVSDSAEIHETAVDTDGTMSMRRLESIVIPAGQTFTLEPAGTHIMLIHLKAPLTPGETFNLGLNFETAGAVSVPVTVTAPGASVIETGEHGEEGHGEGHDHH